MLSYVPVTKPNIENIKMKPFLAIRNGLGPPGAPQARTNWISGGNTNAKAMKENDSKYLVKLFNDIEKINVLPVLQSAPISDIKMFKWGTSSAITTVRFCFD